MNNTNMYQNKEKKIWVMKMVMTKITQAFLVFWQCIIDNVMK